MSKSLLRSVEDLLLAAYKKKREKKKLAQFEEHANPFSQHNEEKILHRLIENQIGLNPFYVDIGASDGTKCSNTARLALNGFQGVCFEYDSKKVAKMATTYQHLKNIRICQTMVTSSNVCTFLKAFDVPLEFGVLSLDIDSCDYDVLAAILSEYRPSIVITEIVPSIPPPIVFAAHDATLHEKLQGQSLAAVVALAESKKYSLVELEYCNAFLMANERCLESPLSAEEAYKKGYLSRSDHKKKFPWCQPVEEALLALTPEKGVQYLNDLYEEYEGKYTLSCKK